MVFFIKISSILLFSLSLFASSQRKYFKPEHFLESDKYQSFTHRSPIVLSILRDIHLLGTRGPKRPLTVKENFFKSVRKGDLDAVIESFWDFPDFDFKDRSERIPLYIAARHGYIELVRFFLSDGVNLEEKNRIGFTALHIAARYGHEEVVKLLLEKGANREARSRRGWTPLQYAKERGHEHVCVLLEKESL